MKLDQILTRQKWAKAILLKYQGEVIDVALARRLAIQFNSASDDTMSYRHLFETFVQYDGSTLEPDFIEILSMQLAGREKELRIGALLLYTRPVRAEWVALEIVDLVEAPWRDDAAGQRLRLLALSGHPAGHYLTKLVPEAWLTFLAYQVGFTKRRRYPGEPWMFVGLRLQGYLVPDEENEDLQFQHWSVHTKLLEYNKQVLSYRLRFLNPDGVEEPVCPMGYDHDCNECSERSDRCPAAIIRVR